MMHCSLYLVLPQDLLYLQPLQCSPFSAPHNMAAPGDAPGPVEDPQDPWGAYMANQRARADPLWHVGETSTCLAWLPAVDPEAPDGYEIEPGDPEDFLEKLRSYAHDTLDPELL